MRFLYFIQSILLWWALFAVVSWAGAEEKGVLERNVQRGPVMARIKIAPAKPRLGDDIVLTLEVEAEKGVELFMPEFGQSLDRFAIVDYVPREKVGSQGQTVLVQQYTLQPPMSGQQSIPPLMIEFIDRRPDHVAVPAGEDAYELLTERISFDVASVLPSGASDQLKPPMGALQPLVLAKRVSWLWWLWIPLLLVVPWAWRVWLKWRGQVRQRTAFDIAHGRLLAMMARARPSPEGMDAFFVELSDIIRRYLEDRFRLRAPERTTEEFLEIASGSPDLTAEHRGFLFQFLGYADRVKFARHLPQAEHVDQALNAAEQFLLQTRGVVPG